MIQNQSHSDRHQPHPDRQAFSVACAVLTISDTRDRESDRSGQLAQQLIRAAGHSVVAYDIVRDEPDQILAWLIQRGRDSTEAIITSGGTGIAPRDTTYDVVEQLLNPQIPGFGELFRQLSYQEIGSRAMVSRAIAGLYGTKLVFCLPGSCNAVNLALTALILPELRHLITQLRGAHPPAL